MTSSNYGILRQENDHRRVNIVADAIHAKGGSVSLPLRYSARKCTDDQLFSLDFRATYFMPLSFDGVTMRKSQNPFCQQIASKINRMKFRLWLPPLTISSSSVRKKSVSATSPTWTDFRLYKAFPLGLKPKSNFDWCGVNWGDSVIQSPDKNQVLAMSTSGVWWLGVDPATDYYIPALSHRHLHLWLV